MENIKKQTGRRHFLKLNLRKEEKLIKSLNFIFIFLIAQSYYSKDSRDLFGVNIKLILIKKNGMVKSLSSFLNVFCCQRTTKIIILEWIDMVIKLSTLFCFDNIFTFLVVQTSVSGEQWLKIVLTFKKYSCLVKVCNVFKFSINFTCIEIFL